MIVCVPFPRSHETNTVSENRPTPKEKNIYSIPTNDSFFAGEAVSFSCRVVCQCHCRAELGIQEAETDTQKNHKAFPKANQLSHCHFVHF